MPATLTIPAGRREVAISRPDKPLFPDGTTKADLARYHAAVADTMVAHLAGRPLNLQRFPDGIESRAIFTQAAPSHFPGWVPRVTVRKQGGTVDHVVVRDPATLVYLADQACITLHAWTSRADRLERPDRLVIDLDPSVEDPGAVREAARDLGALLREVGLQPFAMATGSRGFHVVAPLVRRWDHREVLAFARDVAAVAAARDPQRLTVEQRKAKREGRILVDVLRNAYGHTSVAPYSVRARPGAPVAAPLRWDELDDPATRSDGLTLHTLPERLARDGDPWADIAAAAGDPRSARRALDALVTEELGARPPGG